ncbi:MFS transporter [Streptomyces sp. NPDC021212]|uniref:MFS transporter n=1 Tax=Streptomyces sp. NPDC021212 TaxID=3365118 RepID=UPI0037B7BEF4
MGKARAGSGHWIHHWDPEDREFWKREGSRVARRNLVLSVATEHLGFSVWSLWSVLVLFMSPTTGFSFDAGQKFLLVVVPTLAGAALRLPYRYAVTRFGGRDWTVFATASLLIPIALAVWVIQRPNAPLWLFLVAGAAAGLGGGNFASSMTNISGIFPRRHQGRALGINAGGGNLGVAVVQLLGLLVAATAGLGHPEYLAAGYLPLAALLAVLAARRMDNFATVRARPGALREALGSRHTWWMSLLYVGTFGSFIGYGFAFGLVLQYEFGASALEAVSYTFLGPLLGSLFRPLGGWLADRWGGARVTLVDLVAMAAGTGVLLLASATHSFPLFVATFCVLFVLSGIGNGSAYTMIPAVFAQDAERAVTAGEDAGHAFARARELSGAVIGVTGAVGTLGGVAVNLAFRACYDGPGGTADAAFTAFLGYYAICAVVTWAVYLRGEPGGGPGTGRSARRPEVSHV